MLILMVFPSARTFNVHFHSTQVVQPRVSSCHPPPTNLDELRRTVGLLHCYWHRIPSTWYLIEVVYPHRGCSLGLHPWWAERMDVLVDFLFEGYQNVQEGVARCMIVLVV